VPVKTGQVTVPETQYEATKWMIAHESELNRAYPANYVFSGWGSNRIYN
jgi:dolichyl-diphosphooligosaccharide--protein glycosyltransferase